MSAPEEPAPIHRFVLQAIDPSLGCPVLEMMLCVTELETLHEILGDDASSDPDLHRVYVLSSAELRAIDGQYGAKFDPDGRECRLTRAHPIRDVPYLVHTGFKLFLMLEGAKPFAEFVIEYPAEANESPEEAWFEPHVRSGVLIKKVMADEPFETPIRSSSGRIFEGVRRTFYVLKGEEWRIEAHNLVMKQLAHGPWNDTLERLEGSLLGYTDEQNDWWIVHRKKRRC